MKLFLRIIPLVLLLSGTFSQDFDLADAFDDPPALTPAKPKADKPKDEGDFGFDLSEALKPDSDSDKKPDVNPPKSGGEDPGLDLLDALGPDLKPDKPSGDKPRPGGGGGGGGSLSDSDLFDVAGGGGGGGGDSNYKPDGGGHRDPKYDSGYDSHGGADQPQEAGSGQIAGIVSAVGVALVGAASSYLAYQKKKLCFKLQGGGADPEKGRGTHSQPQVLSNLLQSN